MPTAHELLVKIEALKKELAALEVQAQSALVREWLATGKRMKAGMAKQARREGDSYRVLLRKRRKGDRDAV